MASPVSSSSFFFVVVFSLLSLSIAPISATSEDQIHTKEHVVTLDHSNFSDFVTKHEFAVVEFYAPWCGHCQSLAPEYDKAASILSSHEPQVVLAKVDASEPDNKELASKYEVQGFPTLKIVRKGGTTVQDYNGPRDADGIVTYLKKQAGPASAEINSAEEASTLIDAKKIFIVGIFPKFSGAEFESFIAVAEKLRADYDFGHTLDAKVIPQGESSVSGPTVRLLKPFDELVVDFQDFQVDVLEKLILESSLPTVTLFDTSKDNHPFLVKFFSSSNAKAMLFLNFTTAPLDSFKSKYHDVALLYKGKGISFLLGDLEESKSAFQYFGLKEDQVPLIIIQTSDGKKFLKVNLEADQITPWLKEYKDGLIKPFIKSAPIPEVNNEPVKVVVADNLQEMVLNSGKNVLLEFYAPWCGHCKKLAPILDEVAISFENDPDVIIAKMDATENDIVDERFDVKGYPTLYFRSGIGNISQYQGGRTKEDIIDFINTNKAVQSDSKKDEL